MAGRKDRQKNNETILKMLSPEYVSLYCIDLNTGNFDVLRMDEDVNAKSLVGETGPLYANFDEYSEVYAEKYIPDGEKQEFLNFFYCRNMKQQLLREHKITFHYQSVATDGALSYFEAYAVKGNVDEEEFTVYLAFRNIDSILYKERAMQERLERALDEAKQKNEIISSIAKVYQYVSRIDIQGDYYEEIANLDEEHLTFRKSGILSKGHEARCREYVAEEYQEAFMQFVDMKTLPDRMQNETAIELEYRMKSGGWHKLCFIEKNRDENGRMTHVLCVIQSISEAKKKEQDLLSQMAEAKRNAALKTSFLSIMSHDIRTPINGIMGMLDLANRYPDDLDIQRKCRERVRESANHLTSLVTNILDMNQLESGAGVSQEVTFDLMNVLRVSLAEKRRAAAAKNVSYLVEPGLGEIRHTYLSGNSAYLGRLLEIVVDNAVKFTEPGGRIRVWGKEVKAEQGRAFFEFGCTDTGIGMSSEFINRAFDLFAQEKETSRSEYEGSGLGLSIAKKIADQLGGTLEIRSEKGVGTTVIFRVSFQIKTKETMITQKIQTPKSIEEMRVLLVEDNELNMEIAKYMLEKNSVCVECAVDGQEAVERFASSDVGYYDAVFMDIRMPNLNGWDAARAIRAMKREDAARIPIIAVSANSFAEDIINSRLAGMDRHISKPLSEEKIRDVLEEIVQGTIDS